MTATFGLDGLAEAPAGLLLVLKATAVLASAWLARGALARANPRWRVLTWRVATLGLIAVAALAFAPPFLTWRVAPPPRVEPRPAAVAPASPSVSVVEPERIADEAPAIPEAPRPAAVAAPTPKAAAIDPAAWLAVAWLAGVAVGIARFTLGSWRLSRIVRRSTEAPAAVVEAGRVAAEGLKIRRRVRIVIAPGVASPCLAGVLRPTVLLPSGMGLDATGTELDAVLIHELTHVRNGDLAWNDALHLATIALWFHPLAWRLRPAHADACDAVCDAVAVDRLGDVATYGRALARLALRASAPVPSRGLAMARACDVRRRIESLQRMVHRSPLPRRLVMPALLLSAALAVLVGGAAVIRAQEEPAKPAVPPKPALVVRVLDAATGAPLEGAEVESSFFDPKADKRVKATATTAADGVAKVEHDPGVEPTVLWLIARKPGYVPGSFYHGRGGWGEPFPMPDSKEFRLARGTELGGVVVDEAGEPIEGAEVKLSMPIADTDSPIIYAKITALKTDARGRWHSNELPDSLGDVHINVSHPGYLGASVEAARGDLRAVLTSGETVSGRVVGPGEVPIAGVKVGLRSSVFSSATSEATTDAQGRFTLRHADPGEAYVTVEADGYAPAFPQVTVKPGVGAEGVEVAMEPGGAIRVRVVDAEGKPLPGVQFSPFGVADKQWSRFRATTDAEGRAAWKNAPQRPWEYAFSKRGLMTSQARLTPGDEERVIVMRPPLVVSGSVVDAVTKQPVPKFRVESGVIGEGSGRPSWQSDAKDATDGRYTRIFEFPQTYAIRITARGYKAAESTGFGVDDPGASTRDFALEPQPWLEGVVRRPDGAPDATAQVALLTPRTSAELNGAAFVKGLGSPLVAVDADGRYAFPPPEPPFLLAAVSEAGYVEAKPEDVAKSADLQLRPWGRIEGTVRIGDKPGADAWVEFQADRRSPSASELWVSADDHIQADDQGRFVFDRVIPRPGIVCRTLTVDRDRSRYRIGAEPVNVKPGETVHIDLGGGGRPVVGRAVFDGPVDWPRNRPARLLSEPGTLARIPEGRPIHLKTYVGAIDRDGRFRIEDAPPGRYRLSLQVDPPVPSSRPIDDKPLAKTVRSIVVPPGDGATPVDVGEVVVRPRRILKVGDEAPALNLERIDAAGGRYVLGDRRGRVVVLCFSASWFLPLARQIAELRELEKAHDGDPRFEMVGVWCDDDPAEAVRFARDNGLTWAQTYVGPIGTSATVDFGVTSPGTVVIIGPDGRILSPRVVDWGQAREVVAKALAAMEPSSTR